MDYIIDEQKLLSYEFQKKIGEGTYGKVYKAIYEINQSIVAIKKIELSDNDCNEGIPITIIREISFLKKLKHKNIVELLDIILNSSHIFLVFEYLDGDLRSYINKLPVKFNLKNTQKIAKSILEAILYCHLQGIMHRDLKPQNILIDRYGNIKLADFGLSRSFNFQFQNQKLTQDVATLWYRPPEILLGEKYYDTSIDVYSVGCILAEFIIKKPLFMGDSEIGQLFEIFKYNGTPDECNWPQAFNYVLFKDNFPKFKPSKKQFQDQYCCVQTLLLMDLINLMVDNDPYQRISVEDALQHPFFDQN